MHNEAEIRKAIKPLLEKYGELNTSEIKEKLHEVLEYDEDDKERSTTRLNEMLIDQRIGNIVAHQRTPKKIYPEGFMVDKNQRPALFTAIEGLGNNKKELSKRVIEERKIHARDFHGIKTDWGEKRLRDDLIGNMGE